MLLTLFSFDSMLGPHGFFSSLLDIGSFAQYLECIRHFVKSWVTSACSLSVNLCVLFTNIH